MSEIQTALILTWNSLTSTFLAFANKAAWRNLDTFNEQKNSPSSTKIYFQGNSEARRTEIIKKWGIAFQDDKNLSSLLIFDRKRWNWVNFSHFEILNSTSRRLFVTICSVTARDTTYSRQNDSHGIKVVTQRNSWKSNIFDADSILKKKKSNALVFWYSLFIEK